MRASEDSPRQLAGVSGACDLPRVHPKVAVRNMRNVRNGKNVRNVRKYGRSGSYLTERNFHRRRGRRRQGNDANADLNDVDDDGIDLGNEGPELLEVVEEDGGPDSPLEFDFSREHET